MRGGITGFHLARTTARKRSSRCLKLPYIAPRVMPAREATSSSDVRSQPFSPIISAAARIKAARVRSLLSPFGRPRRLFGVVFDILFIYVFNTLLYSNSPRFNEQRRYGKCTRQALRLQQHPRRCSPFSPTRGS